MVNFQNSLSIALSYERENSAKVYSKPSRTSKMRLFAVIVNGLLFSQNAPPQMFGWVLNTPLQFIPIWINADFLNECYTKKELGRRSHSQMFYKIGVLKNFAIFARKQLYWSLLSILRNFQEQLFYRTSLVVAVIIGVCSTIQSDTLTNMGCSKRRGASIDKALGECFVFSPNAGKCGPA